ncbi:copper chaperone PCu(A)C [Corynebacterium pacaense]|uniref:copper chaperone PCu(A)C n=1 Tax=Corynebacterium pacaense TaxID=1816684 RepID=UPI001FE97946|nr:copper chaperone PCu(A)C [Corynebacterium pacaense]
MKNSKRSLFVGGMVVSAALTLAGCSGGQDSDSATGTPTASATAEASATSDSGADSRISLDNAVVRASTPDNPMTSVFGTLVNNTADAVDITGFTADVTAEKFQLHEVVDGVMQEKPGGFHIEAGQSHELAPGGDHLMIMGLASPVQAGDEVSITLILSDGSEVDLGRVPVRTIAAGDESYGEHGGAVGHDGVEHPEHTGH